MITLKTLPDATAQEVFDQVAIHLLTQNRRSGVIGECKYRWNGLKCAAGCLVADEEYKPEMDSGDLHGNGTGWDVLVSLGIAPRTHETLIKDLQVLHDGVAVGLWFDELLKLAAKHNLNPYDMIKFKGEQQCAQSLL